MADDQKAKIEQAKQHLRKVAKGQAAAGSLGDMVGAWVPPVRRKPDYRYWAALPEWNHTQAAALSLGLDPDRKDLERDPDYVKRLRFIRVSVDAGELDEGSAYSRPSKFPPRVFVDWLNSKRLVVPDELEQLIRESPASKHWPKAKTTSAALKELEENVARLEAENTKLKAENQKLSEKIDGRMKANFFRLIVAMATGRYEYEKGRGTVKSISGDVERIEEKISEATIHRLIKDGQEYLKQLRNK